MSVIACGSNKKTKQNIFDDGNKADYLVGIAYLPASRGASRGATAPLIQLLAPPLLGFLT